MSARVPTRHPALRVVPFIGALIGAAVAAAYVLGDAEAVAAERLEIPWWVLLGLFAGVEVFVLHVQIKREARTVSMSEIPLVLGMFFAPPAVVLAARVFGSGLVYALYRRQGPLKLSFNTALNAAETGLALLVFRAVLGDADPTDHLAWAAAYLGACTASALAGLSVTFVIFLFEGVLRWRDLRAALLKGVPMAVLTTTAGLIAASCLVLDPGTAWLLAAAAVIVVIAYRAYASLSERHLSLERLYRFSQVVSATPEVDEVMRSVLAQARDLLRAEVAELTFVPTGGAGLRVVLDSEGVLQRQEADLDDTDWLWRQVVARNESVLMSRGDKDPAVVAHLAARGMREAIVAPLRGESGVVGLVAVADRMGSVRTFDADDVRLLETVANHASVALEHGRLVDRLRHEAMHDGLTGLPNRAALESAARDALVQTRVGASPGVALLLMDLDGFKEVNDTLGHLHGDLLLKVVADRLRTHAPETALVARLGGDEFAVLLPTTAQVDEALAVGRALLASLEEPASLEDVRLEVGASIGVSVAPVDGDEIGALLKCADVAMYAAKSASAGVVAYRRDLDGHDPAKLLIATELRRGLADDELRVYAQPQLDLRSGEVVGVEVLVRWQHPERGLLLPDEFVPVAERTGLLRPLTATVLGEGVAACARWYAEGRVLGVAVNLSPRSLLDPDLVADVEALLRLHQVPAQLLTLEITEGSVISDLARTSGVLQQLADLGIRLSVDDFGTGYSSLSYLSRLPVHEVKVDKHFVTTMAHDAHDAAIVRSVIDLGQNLGLRVVAEGVEDAGTLALLTELGCDLAQGYHLSRAMPLDELPAWHDAHQAARAGAGFTSQRPPVTPLPQAGATIL
ncbi:MAG: bifunctional diguanylate cyclase/phosphodiesterase [Mycobacteriales bacterium]|nr:bifunctional diguanylate cyclase/phosphodiesterase [Mycobacteriales bacterium]